MSVRTFQTSFSGGEIAPSLFGQASHVKYASGAKGLRNAYSVPHGGVINRQGLEFILETKHSDKESRLMPFIFNVDQAYALEFGDRYVRFFTEGGVVLSGGVPLEVVTTYLEAELFDIQIVQSADVITIVHPSHPPAALIRLSATSWSLTDIVFAPSVAAPTGVAAVKGAGGTGITYVYAVSSVSSTGLEESVVSSSASCVNDLSDPDSYNTITWSSVADVVRYNVYKKENGLFGYIGQTSETTFKDDYIDADVLQTPPEVVDYFNGVDKYPSTVTYFEQRRIFGATNEAPQTVWMTRSGTQSNLTRSIPSQANDSIMFELSSRQLNKAGHLVPLSDLLLFTNSGEWKVTSQNSDAITPTSIWVRQQGYVGASKVPPIISRNSVLFVQAQGNHVADLAYSMEANSYESRDISILAPHLFDGYTITDWSFTQAPFQMVGAIRDDGVMLGLTYLPDRQSGDQGIVAWHKHDTINGSFESICSIPESTNETMSYMIVKRVINGQVKRYVERFRSRRFASVEDSFFVDSGLTYDGAATSTISGLNHLEGEEVAILADGSTHPSQTVVSGSISLNYSASKIQIGLPITSEIETLPVLAQVDGALGLGRKKRILSAKLRVLDSRDVTVNVTGGKEVTHDLRTTEPYGTPRDLETGVIDIVLPAKWTPEGTIKISQTSPLPLTVLSMSLEVEVGG